MYNIILFEYFHLENVFLMLALFLQQVQNALQKPYTALDTFNEALQINPKSAVCKFHRASLYYNSARYQEALAELQELQGLVPKESSVFYLTAKVSSTFTDSFSILLIRY